MRHLTLTDSGAYLTEDSNTDAQPSDTNPTADEYNTFRATASNLDNSTIDGVGGGNKLDVFRLNQDTAPATVENVETVEVTGRDTDGGTRELDASMISGAEEFWSVASRTDTNGGDSVQISDIESQATVGMRDAHDSTVYEVGFATPVTDDNDAVDVAFDDLGVRDGNDGASPSIDGFETFDLTNSGESTTDNPGGDSLETLNISGDGDLTVTGDNTRPDGDDDQHARVVDASNFGGSSLAYAFHQQGGEIDPADGVSYTGNSGENAPESEVVRFAGDTDHTPYVHDTNNGGYITALSNSGEESLEVQGGSGDTAVRLGDAIYNSLDGDFDGTLTLDGGEGSNTLSFEFDDDQTTDGTGDLSDLLNTENASIQNFDEVMVGVVSNDFGGNTAFDMTLFDGATDYGFVPIDNQSVALDAADKSEAFDLSIGSEINNGNELNGLTVNNVGQSSDQTSLNLTLTAQLEDDNGYHGTNSDADVGGLTLNGAGSDDGITDLTVASEFSGERDPDEGADPEVGTLNGDDDRNDVGAISSPDNDGDEQLQSLTVSAGTNVATNDVNMFSGSQDASNTFSIDLSGEGAVNLGQGGNAVQTGGNVNEIAITNAGSGDRQIDLAGNAGDLKADGSTDGQAAGEGVSISGDGSGDVILQADDALLDSLELDGSQAGAKVVADIVGDSDTSVDLSNTTGLDELRLNADLTADAGNGIDSLGADTTVRVENALTNALDITNASAGAASVEVTQGNDIGGGLDVRNVSDLSVTAVDTDDSTNTISGITNTVELGGDTNFNALNLTAESGETLALDAAIEINRVTEFADDNSFTLTVDGEGTSDISQDLDFTTGVGSGTRTSTNDVTINAGGDVTGQGANGAVDLTTVNVDSGDGQSGNDASTVDLTLGGEGAVDVDELNVDNSDTDTINVASEGGDGENLINSLSNTGNLAGGDIDVDGDADLDLGDTDGTAIDFGGGGTVNASSFEGDFTLGLDREASDGDDVTVEVGSGDDTFNIDNDTSDTEDEINDDGDVDYVFSGDAIGTNTIEGNAGDATDTSTNNNRGFALGDDTSGESDEAEDVLDFSNIIDLEGSLDLSNLEADGTGDILDDADGSALLTVDGSAGSDSDVEITAADGQFEGSITLTGVDDATLLGSENFTFG